MLLGHRMRNVCTGWSGWLAKVTLKMEETIFSLAEDWQNAGK